MTTVKGWVKKLGWYSEYFKKKPTKDEVLRAFIDAFQASDSPREEKDVLKVYQGELVKLGITKGKAKSLLSKIRIEGV
jgi:hypothetical protein